MSTSLKLNRKIIYIDQFFISNVLKSLDPKINKRKNDFYINIYNKLNYLVKYLIIICPVSIFHEIETIKINDKNKQSKIEKIFQSLSLGYTFPSPKHLRYFQLFECAINWLSKKSYNLSLNRDFLFDYKINDIKNNNVKKICFKKNKKVLDEQNEKKLWDQYLIKLWSKWQYQKITFNKQLKVELESYKNIAKKINNFRDIEEIKDAFRIYRINESEFDYKIDEFLSSREFQEIPSIKIEPYLWAAIAHQAGTTNKHAPTSSIFYDFRFISRYSPYCDAMFIDKECFELIKFKKVRYTIEPYGTKIFSLNSKKEFINYLKEIEDTVTEEHKKIVEKIYDYKWFKSVQF